MRTTNYQERLQPVIRYLEQHFNEPLNLKEVAALANMSPYHFHRIFHATMQETLANYIQRLRLESVACQLFYTRQKITTLALEHGFSSSQALAKVFRRHFDLTMSDIRQCENIQTFRELLQNSKIRHQIRKRGHDITTLHRYPDGEQQHNRSHAMHTQYLDTRSLAYVRVTGPYGENYEPAMAKLENWAVQHNIDSNECIFIYHDNPDITPADKCRTDLCLTIPDQAVNTLPHPSEIEFQILPAGNYAVIRRQVTDHAQYAMYWDEAIDAIVAADLSITDERPCFEYYHSYDPQTQHADVSFYTAIDE